MTTRFSNVVPIPVQFLDRKSECYYCQQKPDGAMLTMGENMAHVPCVIRKLNELLDPDYDGEPKIIVGNLAEARKAGIKEGVGAKDRITKTTIYNCHNTLEERLAEQDEISFKAGMREGVNNLDWHSTPYQTHGGSPIIQVQMSEAERDALLKR